MRLIAVDADADDDIFRLLRLQRHGKLGQNAAELFAVQHRVVRPLDGRLHARYLPDGIAHAKPCQRCQMQKLLRRLMRTDQIAQIEPAGLGQKASAAPPASGSLADGKDRGFIRRAV